MTPISNNHRSPTDVANDLRILSVSPFQPVTTPAISPTRGPSLFEMLFSEQLNVSAKSESPESSSADSQTPASTSVRVTAAQESRASLGTTESQMLRTSMMLKPIMLKSDGILLKPNAMGSVVNTTNNPGTAKLAESGKLSNAPSVNRVSINSMPGSAVDLDAPSHVSAGISNSSPVTELASNAGQPSHSTAVMTAAAVLSQSMKTAIEGGTQDVRSNSRGGMSAISQKFLDRSVTATTFEKSSDVGRQPVEAASPVRSSASKSFVQLATNDVELPKSIQTTLTETTSGNGTDAESAASFAGQLADAISEQAKDLPGTGSARFRMNLGDTPWGTIRLQIASGSQGLKIQLLTTSVLAGQTIGRQIDQLRQAVIDRGIACESCHVVEVDDDGEPVGKSENVGESATKSHSVVSYGFVAQKTTQERLFGAFSFVA